MVLNLIKPLWLLLHTRNSLLIVVDWLIILSFLFCLTEDRSWEIYWGHGPDAFKDFPWTPRVNYFCLTCFPLYLQWTIYCFLYYKIFSQAICVFFPLLIHVPLMAHFPLSSLISCVCKQSKWMGESNRILQNPGPSSRAYCVTQSMQEFPQRKDSVFPPLPLGLYNFQQSCDYKPSQELSINTFWWLINRDETPSNVSIIGQSFVALLLQP